MTRTRGTSRKPTRRNQLNRLLRQLKPMVTNRRTGEPRVITTVSLSTSERDLLNEAARVHQISRAEVLRKGLPLAVAQLTAARDGHHLTTKGSRGHASREQEKAIAARCRGR